MKKLLFAILLIVVTEIFINSDALVTIVAQELTFSKAQTTCPVLDGEIDKKIYTDYKGERIYFCCSQCIDDFKKNPEKYLKTLKDSGVILEKTPKAK